MIVIITDSRGAGLEEEIEKIHSNGNNVRVLVYPGKGIIRAVKEAESLLNWWCPQQIYVMNGICDITYRDRSTKLVSLHELEVERAVESYVQSLDTVTHFVKILLDGHRYKLIFSEQIGMNLATYNGTLYPHQHQGILNETIERINAEIVIWNRNHEVITPWVARIIHRNMKNGKKTHKYQKLAPDGLHLSEEVRAHWAYELAQAICKNTD